MRKYSGKVSGQLALALSCDPLHSVLVQTRLDHERIEAPLLDMCCADVQAQVVGAAVEVGVQLQSHVPCPDGQECSLHLVMEDNPAE